jgi:hypothetical protein
MTKVTPSAKALYHEMVNAGFEGIMHFIPNSDGFWSFLKMMATSGICISCKDGSGNPSCEIRLCAQEHKVASCALCNSYPCEKINPMLAGLPVLQQDNILLRERGWDAWGKLQDERIANGFTYSGEEPADK